MNNLEELSSLFAKQLHASLDQIKKDARVEGGGLRHGVPEWRVSYFHDHLLRILIFALELEDGDTVRLRSYVAATNQEGSWAYRGVGSGAYPVSVVRELILKDLVAAVLDQARVFANLIKEDELRRPHLGWVREVS